MNILWSEIADAIHLFLFSDKEREKLPYISPEITHRDEGIDISLVDLLARNMIGHAARVLYCWSVILHSIGTEAS
jgi:hypothetical protein